MKKVILLLVILMASVAQAGDWTTWFMGDYNQTGVRVGHKWDRLEVFGQSYWWLWEDVDPPQTYGLGVTYELPVDVNSLPIFNQLAPLMTADASYIGFQGAIEVNGDNEQRGYLGPVAGVVLSKFIFDDVDDVVMTGSEVQYVNYVDQWEDTIKGHELRVTFFVKIKF